ncbi:hypothetical protein HYDPIDRAFT_33743 [Hydnomerulius pinastri MD-312]|uniref:Uncharacterized protein n=1 Tax=Hydnomerulius pinastri MD-312 TaxID=994086 RepID=A0A0C9VMJ2_9AGAM|nr:hypothetical protein HYDPIDRAFT_33743 [Hydnomerulius pinastri MD-312]
MAERDTLKALCQQFSGSSQQRSHPTGHIDVHIDPLLISTPQSDAKQPTPETHPSIKFWNWADWVKWSERAENHIKSSRGIMPFLEGENGEVINARQVKAIRDSMRDTWGELACRNISPTSWGRASTSAHKLFRSLIKSDWPIFRLCNNGWKLTYLASISYPGWKRAHLDEDGNRKKKVNVGSDSEDNNDSEDSEDNDNAGASSSKTRTKKRKLAKAKSEVSAKKAKSGAAVTAKKTKKAKAEVPAKKPIKNEVAEVPGHANMLEDPETSTKHLPLQVKEDIPMPPTTETEPKISTTCPPPNEAIPTSPAAETTISVSINASDNSLLNSDSANLACGFTSSKPSVDLGSSTSADKENISLTEAIKPKGKKGIKLLVKNPLSMSLLAAAEVDMPKLPPPPPPMAPQEQEHKPAKKLKGKMCVPSEQCGCLCAQRWVKQVNNLGTKDEFKVYWKKTLSAEQ